jgi:ABC-2 type transport system ATP-binding protein
MAVIEFHELVKKYGANSAVSNLTAEVQEGRITGFFGPNGAGKSTALRCLLGLATPTSGEALINGLHYSNIKDPLRKVGAVLDSGGFKPGFSARRSLKIIAATAGITDTRIDEVLDLVELTEAADRRTKGYSLGMKQRLSLAAALLGSPDILVLDEPSNGLDPIGIAWLRGFLRDLADKGHTILVSSHQLAEMQHTVDDVLIINNGKLIAEGPIAQVAKGRSLEEAFLDLVMNK